VIKGIALDEQSKVKLYKTDRLDSPGRELSGMADLSKLGGNRVVQRLVAQRVGYGSFHLDDETAGRIDRERSRGQLLDSGVQTQMDAATGHDLSNVRVHTSPAADALNRQLHVKAFTTGRDIFFREGAYQPHTSSGQELIAHELTQVVQQSTGAVGGGSGKMTVNAPGDACEQEADSLAKAIVSANRLVRRQVAAQADLLGSHCRLGAQRLEVASYVVRTCGNQAVDGNTNVVQRWPVSVHEELTTQGVEEIFSAQGGRRPSDSALRRICYHSAEMDLRLPELWFNLVGKIVGLRKDRHERLVEWYENNPTNALNHGEGGLYKLGKTTAAILNRNHHILFEQKAREMNRGINWSVLKRKAYATKQRVLEPVFQRLGDALHIAQDRGAHGEGGKGWGHDTTSCNCDDPDENRIGYEDARQSTFEVLARASDYLVPLLETGD